ncbi:hypothetical protein [Alishewanella sp. HL-SH05]|uniref:hypothetical protein n=1 Tax=Alishewanella sp. HL-SH05 TaxID=3461145 RepID=UPI00404194BD
MERVVRADKGQASLTFFTVFITVMAAQLSRSKDRAVITEIELSVFIRDTTENVVSTFLILLTAHDG